MDALLQTYSPTNPEFESILKSELERIWNLHPERLLSILYRIDIKESIVFNAFALGVSKESIDLLAKAIIERMEQKRQLRLRYSK